MVGDGSRVLLTASVIVAQDACAVGPTCRRWLSLAAARDFLAWQLAAANALDGNGHGVLEKGEAIRREGDWWDFVSQAEGKRIVTEGWDLPEHVARFVLYQT